MSAFRALAIIGRTCTATIAIELPLAALLFGARTRRQLAVVALAQVMTNPVVELCCLLVGWSLSAPFPGVAWATAIAVEVAAVVAEAWAYRETDVFERPLLASIALNAASFCIGCVVGLILG